MAHCTSSPRSWLQIQADLDKLAVRLDAFIASKKAEQENNARLRAGMDEKLHDSYDQQHRAGMDEKLHDSYDQQHAVPTYGQHPYDDVMHEQQGYYQHVQHGQHAHCEQQHVYTSGLPFNGEQQHVYTSGLPFNGPGLHGVRGQQHPYAYDQSSFGYAVDSYSSGQHEHDSQQHHEHAYEHYDQHDQWYRHYQHGQQYAYTYGQPAFYEQHGMYGQHTQHNTHGQHGAHGQHGPHDILGQPISPYGQQHAHDNTMHDEGSLPKPHPKETLQSKGVVEQHVKAGFESVEANPYGHHEHSPLQLHEEDNDVEDQHDDDILVHEDYDQHEEDHQHEEGHAYHAVFDSIAYDFVDQGANTYDLMADDAYVLEDHDPMDGNDISFPFDPGGSRSLVKRKSSV